MQRSLVGSEMCIRDSPYIFHDETLTRLLGKNDVFSNLQSSEIEDLRIFESHKIPRLDETLQAFPDMYFQIDVKTDEVAMPALEVIHQCKAEDRVCIASFNSARLSKVNNKYPEICLSVGPNEVSKMLLSSFGLYKKTIICLLYTSPSPRDYAASRMPSSA